MPGTGISSYSTFGDLLKYLRRRAQLTQRELAIAVGYTESHISRLETNQRLPDLATVAALFVPALGLEEEPEMAARLLQLAANVHGNELHAGESLAVSHTQAITEITESVERIPSNLPIQLTSFIGRGEEIASLTRLLSGEKPARLATLTGPGGIGKTRLALQLAISLAHLYRDGVWFVDLTPLSASGPQPIPQTVASALNIPQARSQSVEESLIASLRAKQTLIVLDNCEHLVHAAAQFVERILRACAHVQILATSREPLNVPGEVNYRVPSLSLPGDPDGELQNVVGNESAQLFLERAGTTQPSLIITPSNAGVLARICMQLDGIPLAIELAAARTSVLSLRQIQSRLQDRFQLLTGGHITLPRHQTLHATIEWSHNLLSEAEKVLFRRLAVFAGGWTLESANLVSADQGNDILDLLAQLVNKSLVVVDVQPDSEVRYRMLETIREFAREKLSSSGEMEVTRARHFEYFFTMAQEAEPRLFRSESSIDWAENEIDNLRAALAWSLEKDTSGKAFEERSRRGLELMTHVWPLWLNRGHMSEGSEWMDKLLAVHTDPTPARARALLLAGDFARYRGDFPGQVVFIEESLALSRRLGDKQRIAWGLMEMGLVERDFLRYPEAIHFLEEGLSLFQELHENLWVYRVAFVLAETHMANGNLEAAKPLVQQGLELCRAENDPWQIAWGIEILGNLRRMDGNLEEASRLFVESLHLKVSVKDKLGIIYALEAFAQLAAARKQFHRAGVLWGAADQLSQTIQLHLIPVKLEIYTSLIATARAQLGEDMFTSAWKEGQSMKLQEAIDYALAEPVA
jgi:predicted ATPase/DNA-binding XRE family transcriptional regulator